MKKVLLTLALLLTLTTGMEAAGQKHRHTPRQEKVDSTNKDAVVVYSDTTSMDTMTTTKHKGKVTITTPTSPWSSNTVTYEMDDENFGSMLKHLFVDMDSNGIVLIIIALFYFINKNRKEKMRLAQMAMQQGQPIPDQLLNNNPTDTDDEYQKGMRQCFVGVGLMVFLGYAAGQVGFGIGALVFCIGLGKVFASKTAQKRNDKNNELNQHNYD